MKESTKNAIAFFILGVSNNFVFHIMLSAANNIIGDKAPTGVVLFANIFPGLILVIIYPFI